MFLEDFLRGETQVSVCNQEAELSRCQWSG